MHVLDSEVVTREANVSTNISADETKLCDFRLGQMSEKKNLKNLKNMVFWGDDRVESLLFYNDYLLGK